jgi:hypothetical protein
MAIGQLYDYRRSHEPPVHLAVLLPHQPGPEGIPLLPYPPVLGGARRAGRTVMSLARKAIAVTLASSWWRAPGIRSPDPTAGSP